VQMVLVLINSYIPGLWDFYEALAFLDENDYVYVCAKEGFCCDGSYVVVEGKRTT
jgi:hypothetical protein